MEENTGKLTLQQLLSRMEDRKKMLIEKKEQRKTESENLRSENENSDYFYNSFIQMKEQLEIKIKESKDVPPNELKKHLDSLVQDVQSMQGALNESSMFLPAFQIKKAQQVIDEVNEKSKACIDELQPKQKFAFKPKRKTKPNEVKNLPKKPDSVDSKTESNVLDKILKQNFFGFQDKNNETLIMNASQLENRQFNLQNLKNCKVIALGNPSTIQAANLEECTVIIGPISRSVFVKNCSNCTFVMACQQLRIHDTTQSSFYLHVTGAAIIESCKSVKFAPYNLSYPEIEKHYMQSQLDRDTNNWNKIDDFHWLNENEKSPNFSLIDEQDRKSDWIPL